MKPRFHFGDRVVMTADTFDQLPTVTGSPEAAGRNPTKALVDHNGRHRWHVIERRFISGEPVAFAQPIVIRLYAKEES